MTQRRIYILAAGLAVMALAAFLAVGLGPLRGSTPSVVAEPAGPQLPFDQDGRMMQIIETLGDGQCIPSQRAIDDAMEVLYGGLRVLPSKDDPTDTTDADAAQRQHELALAAALEQFSRSDTPCPVQKGRALDLKLFIEEISQVAEQLGQATSQCGAGDALDQPPCDELRPLLGEDDQQSIIGGQSTGGPPTLVPGYSYFLRSPALAPTFRNIDEDTFTTEPLSSGDCASVLKETKGMMLKATFERIGLDYTVTYAAYPSQRCPFGAYSLYPRSSSRQ